MRGTQIALLYSSNLRGDYEPCGCPSHPLGGIARRASLVDGARIESDAVVQVDAGDLLWPPPITQPGLTPPLPAEMERRAKLMLAALARTGIDAFAPGETDLLLGPGRLAAWARDARVPVVAANLVDRQGKLVFAADRMIQVAGIKVGIFGILDPPAEDSERWKPWGLAATDPVEATRREAAALRGQGARIVVGLMHVVGGLPRVRTILGGKSGVDWAVLGHSGMNLDMPEDVGATRALEAFEKGKYLGRLDLHVVGGSLKFADRGQRAQLMTILADHRAQVADYKKRAAEDKGTKLKEYFSKQIHTIELAIERESAIVAVLPVAVAGSWFENRLIPLEASLPDHQGVALLVRRYNQESEQRARQGLPAGIAYVRVGDAPARGAGQAATSAPEDPSSLSYAGTAACGVCHTPALKFWQSTKHARALLALREKGREKDPACAGCHVTGYLQIGGTQNINVAVERFANVGCEACHGPGLAHITAADKKTSTRRRADKVVCLGCHTPDQTNREFDYDAFSRAILGPGHGQPGGT